MARDDGLQRELVRVVRLVCVTAFGYSLPLEAGAVATAVCGRLSLWDEEEQRAEKLGGFLLVAR
jgi:hypothetical protein